MPTFDFDDGKGPVPAHPHPSGGGWVADTATVAPTAYVGLYARVSGNAKVCGTARVYGDALISGEAQVSGNARVFGHAWVCGHAWVSGKCTTTSVREERQLPPQGTSFKAYKGCHQAKSPVLVILEIPEDALINRNPVGRKYRANKAKVLQVLSLEDPNITTGQSFFDHSFTYEEGQELEIDHFDTSDRQCSNGIHFYLTAREALEVANRGI